MPRSYTRTEPSVHEITAGWIAHFASADRDITWLELEREYSMWLDDNTLLLGRIDAKGRLSNGDTFFADWKTIGPYRPMEVVKMQYELDPQMLTYALLTSKEGTSNRYCVRWAVKSNPPTYYHCWYRYEEKELDWWHGELEEIADRIRTDRKSHAERGSYINLPWLRNYQTCFKYGANYPCPFYGSCSSYKFNERSLDLIDRVSHLATERELDRSNPNLVVLDATRVKTWLDCPEKFRRQYEQNLTTADSAALETGKQFHDLLDRYYQSLVLKSAS